jgi:hypothetical protein
MRSFIMTESRFGIRPFPRVATYPTSWNGEMTFEQISEDIRPRAARMLLRQYRVWPQDMPDCLQNGLMYIWQQLVEDHEFLAKMTVRDAAIVICHRSKSTSIRKQNLRYEYMEDFWAKHDFKHPLAGGGDSQPATPDAGHAPARTTNLAREIRRWRGRTSDEPAGTPPRA